MKGGTREQHAAAARARWGSGRVLGHLRPAAPGFWRVRLWVRVGEGEAGSKHNPGLRKACITFAASSEEDARARLAAWQAAGELPRREGASSAEAGRLGGSATLARHGRRHLRRTGRRGGVAKVNRYGSEYMSNQGREGARRRWGARAEGAEG